MIDRVARGLALNAAAPSPFNKNVNTGQLPKWRAAVQSARLGIKPARLVVVGDSTSRGWGALPANANAFSQAWPAQITRDIASRYGLTGSWDSVFGDAWQGTGLNGFDTRVAFTGGMAPGASLNATTMTFGGAYITATATGAMTFLPTGNVDTFRIYYVQAPGNGSFSWKVDSGSATTVSQTGSALVTYTTVSAGSAGAHTLTLAWVSGTVQILGIEGYVAAASDVRVLNGAIPSSTAGHWTNSAQLWNPSAGGGIATALAPDLTLINLGINDLIIDGASAATYKARLQIVINQWKAVGDVALVGFHPLNTSVAPQGLYSAALYALGAANSCPVLDFYARWGTGTAWSAHNALGFYFDGAHATKLGYRDQAEYVASIILGV